jgi:hypothetical protein
MTRARHRIVIAVAIGAAAALLAGGCGGSQAVSKDEYGAELRGVMGELEEAYGDAGSAVAPGADNATASVEQTVQKLRTSQLALRDAGNRLEDIDPPEQLADDHAALVQGVRDMADAVDLLIGAQEQAERDPAEAKRLAREFATDESFGAVEAAASRIESAGVDAGL